MLFYIYKIKCIVHATLVTSNMQQIIVIFAFIAFVEYLLISCMSNAYICNVVA